MNSGRIGSLRGSYYRLRVSDNKTTSEGRDPTLFTLTKGQKAEMIAAMLYTSKSSKETVRALQRKLYRKAKDSLGFLGSAVMMT